MNHHLITHDDISQLIPLMTSLGYPVDLATLTNRLKPILHHDDYFIMAREVDGLCVAFCAYVKMYHIEADGFYARIIALATHQDYQRQGHGKLLLDAVSNHCKSLGCTALTLNSGLRDEREQAHTFYQNYGFIRKSYGYGKQI